MVACQILCTGPSVEVSHERCLETDFGRSPREHLLQWISAVTQAICFPVPRLKVSS